MLSRLSVRALSTAAVLGLVVLAASPAGAATEVAKGAANALSVSLAGNPQGSGTYTASNDGTTQTTSGTNRPVLTILGGFNGAGAGTLNQDAVTTTGSHSAACAGLAGSGATVIAVGKSTCLEPTKTLSLNSGTVDLTGLDPNNGVVNSAFNQAIVDVLTQNGKVPNPLTALAPQLATTLTTVFQSGFAALQDPALSLDLKVIQASCTADPGSATGTANIVGGQVNVTFPAGSGLGTVPLLDFNPSPAPNTKITADLGAVAAKVIASLQSSLSGTIAAIPGADALAPLAAALSGTTAVTDGLATIAKQLPLDQVLTGTLNKQSRPNDSAIDVTALELNVLPGASQVLNSPLASIQIGHVSCAAADVARVDAPSNPTIADASVPAEIDSGLPGNADSRGDLYRTLLGALLLVGAGGIAVRRLLLTRSAD